MSQESREIPKNSCLLPSNETEMSISDVSVSPAKKRERTSISQAIQEETEMSISEVTVYPAKKRETISNSQAIQEETEMSISDLTILPWKKRERTSISQALQEYRFMDSQETIPPAKKIRTNMSQEPRVPSKKTEEFRLFGVSIHRSSAFSTRTDEELKKTNCLKDAEKVLISTTLCLYNETWPCGNPDYPNVTYAPRNEEKLKKINCMKDPEKVFISTTLCLYDETWSCGNPDYPNVTYAPRNEEKLKSINCMKDPEKVFISTTLCLYDETWPCGNPDYPNVTYAPRNEELTEQTKKIEEVKEDLARYGDSTDPWIIKKDLNKTDNTCGQLYLSRSDVEQHILRYLSEDDQKKLGQGDGITVNVHDHETDTSHQVFLMRWISKQNYCLKGRWRHDFVRRRGLRAGDKIGLFWDRFRYKLQFRVLSRATAKAPAEEKKPLNQ